MQREERSHIIQQVVVTATQMQAIESRLFKAGMPVTALMEKVAGLIAARVCHLYPLSSQCRTVGVLVGPGHNGGDALVVARELHFRGYAVLCYQPLAKAKELTAAHGQYVASLGIPCLERATQLDSCDLIIDGLFGFGLNRALAHEIAKAVDVINALKIPVVSIDLPSGVHTDTGAVLGTAIAATHTLCLGLWKRAFLQDQALAYLGQVDLIDFDIPLADIFAVLGSAPALQKITMATATAALPFGRSLVTHKYKEGHVLLICGSQRYMGAAILTTLAARASGVGLMSVAVPASLKMAIALRIPDAIIIACPETDAGAIAHLPNNLALEKYDAIACGPGLTLDAVAVVQTVLQCNAPLLLDADGLNGLAQIGVEVLASRNSVTILTPHVGELRRLFPEQAVVLEQGGDRMTVVNAVAAQSGGIIVLKGARTAIAHPDGRMWINAESSPALARGGSGDVLTGLLAGLMAQAIARSCNLATMVPAAVWWHAQAGQRASQDRTELGVDAETLCQYLIPTIQEKLGS